MIRHGRPTLADTIRGRSLPFLPRTTERPGRKSGDACSKLSRREAAQSYGRKSVVRGLLIFIILMAGCGSEPAIYDRDTSSFRFNWRKEKDLTKERRAKFESQTDHNIRLLEVKLQDTVILEALRIANNRYGGISKEQIQEMDKTWITSGDEIVAKMTDFQCNESLRIFQAGYAMFAEIFVTEMNGLNVCVTNKTSDYYQADEEWWTRTVKQGQSWRQPNLEFDESAGVFAVPIYVPVRDPANGNLLGAAKAVVLETKP